MAMELKGIGEFRGFSKRHSKNGNEYHILNFEDADGYSLGFYVNNQSLQNFHVGLARMEKGREYNLYFNLHFNSFQNRQECSLFDVEEIIVDGGE